jgi:hypothetical protein
MPDSQTPHRAEHYRLMARSARVQADAVKDPEIRGGYLELAERWVRLAERVADEPLSFAAAEPPPPKVMS